MNTVDDVPFQTPLGPLGEEVPLVTAPEVTVPDCYRILRQTEYGFSLEKWIVTGQQPVCVTASCPPYWLMYSSPQVGRKVGDPWARSQRPRSHSLSSADSRRLHHRTVTFLISDPKDGDECRYEEDEETLPGEGARRQRSAERPRGVAPRDALSRVKDAHGGPPARLCGQDSRQSHRGSLTSLHAAEQHRSPQVSPCPAEQKKSKKKPRPLGRRISQNTLLPRRGRSPSRPQQQQRPSSAGPLVRNRRQMALSTGGFFFDSAELLSALSPEERELLETITEQGYPLRTAILALQKTGYHNPDKILKYLVASNRLCELGYDEAQVEEALEMFQDCESKAAEFLRLLTQFNEMGFQQSAIKEVLLVHGNHRERALEELMTRMA